MKERFIKFALFIAVSALIVILGVEITVLAATNDSTQRAYTDKVTTIAIKDQAGSSEITTITFPTAAPDTEVITPYNNLDGSGSTQEFGAKPVAQLITGTNYNLHISVTDTNNWDELVVDEYILCSTSTTLSNPDFDSLKYALSTWDTVTDMGTQTVTDTVKYFYLTLNLDALAGQTASSTIAVLGETI